LRQKIPVEQVLDQYKIKSQPKKRREITTKRKSLIREKPLCVRSTMERAEVIAPRRIMPREVMAKPEPAIVEAAAVQEVAPEPEPEREWFRAHVDELDGTLSARIMDRNQNVLKEVAVRDLARELKEANGDVSGVIFDGVVTQRILDIAAEKGLEYLIGAKMGNVAKSPSCIRVLTKEA
ncbi:MAG TPA: DNA primase, partial [Methanothrix sp.]|nr:DNA primase [Methanothrix sp.]